MTNEPQSTPSASEPICDGNVMCEHKRCWDAARAAVRERINASRKEWHVSQREAKLPTPSVGKQAATEPQVGELPPLDMDELVAKSEKHGSPEYYKAVVDQRERQLLAAQAELISLREQVGKAVEILKKINVNAATLQPPTEPQVGELPLRSEAIKVYSEWAGVSEKFLAGMANSNPDRTGWNASVLMTQRCLKAEAELMRTYVFLPDETPYVKEADVLELRAEVSKLTQRCDELLDTGEKLAEEGK